MEEWVSGGHRKTCLKRWMQQQDKIQKNLLMPFCQKFYDIISFRCDSISLVLQACSALIIGKREILWFLISGTSHWWRNTHWGGTWPPNAQSARVAWGCGQGSIIIVIIIIIIVVWTRWQCENVEKITTGQLQELFWEVDPLHCPPEECFYSDCEMWIWSSGRFWMKPLSLDTALWRCLKAMKGTRRRSIIPLFVKRWIWWKWPKLIIELDWYSCMDDNFNWHWFDH